MKDANLRIKMKIFVFLAVIRIPKLDSYPMGVYDDAKEIYPVGVYKRR